MLIRYPGSKAKLTKELFSVFPEQVHSLWSQGVKFEYREPFFGAGAVGFDVLGMIDRNCGIWVNDKDPGMAALWTAVRDCPRQLCNKIQAFSPTAEMFYELKRLDDEQVDDVIQRGFNKLALHRLSFSGLGYKAGGPIGGVDQANAAYRVDCRWKPSSLIRDVEKLHKHMAVFGDRMRITCGDFQDLIDTAPVESFIYLDPPYYDKGPELYKFSMAHEEHVRLAESLRECKGDWVLSYDDHPVIRELYSWAKFVELEAFKHMKYTIGNSKEMLADGKSGKRPKNKEVAIVKP